MFKIKYLIIIVFIISSTIIVDKFLFASYDVALPNYETESVSEEIRDLNNDIESKKDELKDLKSKQDSYQKEIRDAQARQSSLDNQLSILDNRLADAEIGINSVKLNIDKSNLEIKKTNLEINNKSIKIETEKEQLALALKLLYQQGDKSDLEVMLSHDNFSEYLDQMKYLKDINSGIIDSLDSLKRDQEQLTEDKASMEIRREGLSMLYDQLEEKQNALTSEQDSKVYLLSQTNSSEKEYQRLLNLAKQEQQAASADITQLEKAVRERLSRLDNNQLENAENASDGMIWPVTKNVITAYFHDPEYPYRHLFEHPAIDIRAGQGTQLKAADFGYVGRVKFTGDGSYAYIMLIHDNGLSTVYGHVSKVYVEEDEYVSQGQVIGLSGGMPGTAGAGRLTTGPHLHFEVRLDGIPVNPLEYISE